MNTNSKTDEQRQKVKKFIVFAVMGIVFAGCMYIIFSPNKDKKTDADTTTQGFNPDLPMPTDAGIIGDKRDAYEQEHVRQRQEERMRSLHDFSALLGDVDIKTDEVEILPDDETAPVPSQLPAQLSTPTSATRSIASQSRQPSSVHSSAQAYQDLNRTLGSFYETPREDPEKERLREEVEELKSLIYETESRKSSVDEQLELMERSFQMAARYMPGVAETDAEPAPTETTTSSGKTVVVPVTQVRERTVSALLPEMSDAEFMETFSRPRNMSFLTATANANAGVKNTVSACIHNDQTVMDGQNVRLRLLEPMQAGNVVIPRNTLISGVARIQGERLGVTVNSLEHGGMILPVELLVYDLDGQSGIFIPNMAELSAAKEIVANMGTSAGTSITLSDDAGKQFAADMGRNAIQGVSQFTAKKLREVKVHLKADYKIYLLLNNK
jgi:conjugative transposon TraM protein